MSDDDISIDEKRVYGAKTGVVELAVATELGVVRVAVSGEQVGEFGLEAQVDARDIVATSLPVADADGGRRTVRGVAVATDEDVMVGEPDTLTRSGFGPAVAVGRNGEDLLAADEEGGIARWEGSLMATGTAEGGWSDIAVLDADVRAFDGDLVAASDGVHRITSDGVQPAGLDDAHDVAAGMAPHAATADGLYHLGNGWMDVLDGSFRVVEITPDGGRVDRGHAATTDVFYEHHAGDWLERDVPGSVTDVAHGPRTYAITEDGSFLLRRDDGWHSQALGVPGAKALAIVDETA